MLVCPTGRNLARLDCNGPHCCLQLLHASLPPGCVLDPPYPHRFYVASDSEEDGASDSEEEGASDSEEEGVGKECQSD